MMWVQRASAMAALLKTLTDRYDVVDISTQEADLEEASRVLTEADKNYPSWRNVDHSVYAAWEFVHLIEGHITITPDGGEPQQMGPGDAFVVEKGFHGTWRIEEKVLKHFAIRMG